MDVREKMVELIGSTEYGNGSLVGNNFQKGFIEKIATHLIANGVTVQEWISVKDRLPEVGEYVICIAKRNPFSMFMPMVARIKKNGWVNPITEQYISEVTHWMPLPQPPKGE